MQRQSKVWQVYQDSHGTFRVKDLPGPIPGSGDRRLIYQNEHGEIDAVTAPEHMLDALYDLYQVRDDIVAGDQFDTQFGLFLCEGVHVIPWTRAVTEEPGTVLRLSKKQVEALSFCVQFCQDSLTGRPVQGEFEVRTRAVLDEISEMMKEDGQ